MQEFGGLYQQVCDVDAKKLLKKNYYYFSLDTNTVEEVMKLKLEQFSLDYE